MSLRIGLIGLGVMGVPMAKNIAAAGLPLTVYNRSEGPRRQFDGTAAHVARSAAEVFERADAVIVMLNDGAASDAALGRTDDGFAVEMAGRILVNTATVTPSYSKALGDAVAAAGGEYLEAPVSGSKAPAEAGELLVMTAGDVVAAEKLRPVFDAIGKETIHCGPVPAAMAMKSASNLLLAGLMSGLAESVNFARAAGLDLDLYSKVIADGPMGNAFLKMKLPRALAQDYAPQASVRNVAYSLDVMIDAAHAAGVATPCAETMRATCAKALSEGRAEDDVIALTEVLKDARK